MLLMSWAFDFTTYGTFDTGATKLDLTGSQIFLQIAIVITDGKQTTSRGPYTQLSDASRGLKLKKVQVYSLGIGKNLEEQQLQDIASSNDKVFYATSFAELTPVANEIVQNSCPGRSLTQTLDMYRLFTIYANLPENSDGI